MQQIGTLDVSSDGFTATLTGSYLIDASDPVSSIFVGDYPCSNLTQLGPNSVSCSLPVSVSAAGVPRHLAGYTSAGTINSTGASYTFPLVLGGLSTASGSVAGGTIVRINGSGFSVTNTSQNIVFLGPASLGPTIATSAYVSSVQATSRGSVLTVVMPPAPAVFTGPASAAYDLNVWVQAPGAASPLRAVLRVAYTFVTALTPVISIASPLSGPPGTTIVISGRGFASTAEDIAATTVTIGGSPCNVVTWQSSNSSIECVSAGVPAGSFPILVYVPGAGLAMQAPSGKSMYTSTLTATSLSRTVVGYGGGVSLTIDGAGFAAIVAAAGSPTIGAQAVTICNSPCTVTAATPKRITCTTGPLTTQAALAQSNIWQAAALSPASGSLSPLLETLFDGDVGTGTSSCSTVLDLGPTTLGIVSEVWFFPTYLGANRLAYATFSGSNDASTWTTMATAPPNPHSGWNNLVIFDEFAPGFNFSRVTAYRYLRMKFATASCSFQELAWVGYSVAKVPLGTCPVYVTVTGPSEPRAVLASITPALATAAPPTTTVQLPQTVLYSLSGASCI